MLAQPVQSARLTRARSLVRIQYIPLFKITWYEPQVKPWTLVPYPEGREINRER